MAAFDDGAYCNGDVLVTDVGDRAIRPAFAEFHFKQPACCFRMHMPNGVSLEIFLEHMLERIGLAALVGCPLLGDLHGGINAATDQLDPVPRLCSGGLQCDSAILT